MTRLVFILQRRSSPWQRLRVFLWSWGAGVFVGDRSVSIRLGFVSVCLDWLAPPPDHYWDVEVERQDGYRCVARLQYFEDLEVAPVRSVRVRIDGSDVVDVRPDFSGGVRVWMWDGTMQRGDS